MRVTANTYTNSLMDQLNNLSLRQNRLQIQAATGQRVQSPEDDPSAIRRALDLQNEAQMVAQYQKNIATEQNRAEAVYGALKSLKTISDRANEIATRVDELKSPTELATYANEVSELLKQAVQIANTQQNGAYLFAGTRSDQAPFTVTTDASNRVASVTYQGNQSIAPTEISSGLTLSAQVVGANNTGAGPRGLFADSAAGADLFNHLISLQNHLVSGDVAGVINTDRAQLATDEDNLIWHMAANGVVQSRLEASASQLNDRANTLDSQVTGEVGADFAQTLVQFNATQTAFQAALQSGSQIMNLNLMNYLR
ncbi:MAG TPA: flagellin [Clostridia bacterium]|nr:flagellin [Clostridia bacterium]